MDLLPAKMARTWNSNYNRPQEFGYISASSNQLAQAYRLYSLALANTPDMASMNRMREMDVSLQAKWRLAAAYALAGKPEVAKSLINGLNTEVKPYRELGGTFGSSLRDRAMILETLTLAEDKEAAARLVTYISSALSNRQWYGTQNDFLLPLGSR